MQSRSQNTSSSRPRSGHGHSASSSSSSSSRADMHRRFTSPDSSDERRRRAPPSPTGAVFHGSMNEPEIIEYLARDENVYSRESSEDTVFPTAANNDGEQEQLVQESSAPTRPPRTRQELEAFAAMVSDPVLDDYSDVDDYSDDEESVVGSPEPASTLTAPASTLTPTPPSLAAIESTSPTKTVSTKPEWHTANDVVDYGATSVPDTSDEEYESKKVAKMIHPNDHMLYEPPVAFLKPIFKPRGKWTFSEGQDLVNVRVIKNLGDGAFSKVFIKEGELYGENIIFVSKEWNLDENAVGFFRELALYTSKRYLLSLQGVCVPQIIGIFRRGPATTIAFELPHANSWMEAHPDLPNEVKEKIVDAYRMIHAKGVAHIDVGYRHMLISDDHKVTIIDFNYSGATEPHPGVDIYKVTDVDLAREVREVRVKLRCEGAVENEFELLERYEELKARDDLEYEERCEVALRAYRATRGTTRKRKSPDDEESDASSEDDEAELVRRGVARDEAKVCGVDIKTLQTAEDLYTWLTRAGTSKRMVVPGMTPNLDSLPSYNPDRKEGEKVREFLKNYAGPLPRTFTSNEPALASSSLSGPSTPAAAAAPTNTVSSSALENPPSPSPPMHSTNKAAPSPTSPVEQPTDLHDHPPPTLPPPIPTHDQNTAAPRKFWSLPKRVMKGLGSFFKSDLVPVPVPALTSGNLAAPINLNGGDHEDKATGSEERSRKRVRV